MYVYAFLLFKFSYSKSIMNELLNYYVKMTFMLIIIIMTDPYPQSIQEPPHLNPVQTLYHPFLNSECCFIPCLASFGSVYTVYTS